jgi:hypothetical protein
VGSELLPADGRKDRPTNTSQPIVAFRNFVNAPSDILKYMKCPLQEVLLFPDALSLCESQFIRAVGLNALLMVVSFVSGK